MRGGKHDIATANSHRSGGRVMGILLKGLSLKAIPDDEYMVVRIWNNGSISTAACSYGVNHGEKRAFEVPTPHDALIDVSEL